MKLRKKTEGFTLIELLVVIAVIAILAAILVPAVTKVINDAKWTEMKSNGKNMYTAVFADAVDANAVGFPVSGAGGYTSTEQYIEALAGQALPPGAAAGATPSKVLPAGPDFFAGPGVKAATAWSTFMSNNHAWRVIAGQDETADAGTPFFISRNFSGTIPTTANTTVIGTGDVTSSSGSPAVKMTGWDKNICVAFHGAGSEVVKVTVDVLSRLNASETNITTTDFLAP